MLSAVHCCRDSWLGAGGADNGKTCMAPSLLQCFVLLSLADLRSGWMCVWDVEAGGA